MTELSDVRRRGRHRHIGRMEVLLGPLRALERPLVLVPLDEFLARMAHLQLHRRLLCPAGVVAFEEAAEEPLLQVEAVVRIEVRPMLDAVHFKPFVLGCGAHEAFEIAARMQALPAPIGGREQGHFHLVPVRHTRLPELVGVELARQTILVKIAPILAEFLFRQSLRSRHPVAGHAALEAPRAAPVLQRINLRLRPTLDEATAEDAAMMRHVAIEIGGAFPGANGGEVLGLQRGRLPLVLGVVGDAVEADLAVRPGLLRRPTRRRAPSPAPRAATRCR